MHMTVDHHTEDHGEPDGGVGHGEGSATRRRILQIALTLMAQRGVDGTSMRDLAAAAGLNVASLYHYFPSKRDLLESVLVEQGFLPLQAPRPELNGEQPGEAGLSALIADICVSMFEIEDFIRLMVGESIRGEATARAVGIDLFTSFQKSIEDWVVKHRPDLVERAGAGEVARLLSAMVVGLFVQHAAGVLGDEDCDLTALALRRAGEAARVVGPPA